MGFWTDYRAQRFGRKFSPEKLAAFTASLAVLRLKDVGQIPLHLKSHEVITIFGVDVNPEHE